MQHVEAHASDRGRDLGRRISETCIDAARKAFAEQHLGEWQGMNRATFLASLPPDRHWFAAIDEPAPGGESFRDLYNRATARSIASRAEHAGRDISRSRMAERSRPRSGSRWWGPAKGLAFDIDNCSVTRLDHSPSVTAVWRLPMVNQQPWIADASHNAMHQPAGPEIVTREPKLARARGQPVA